MPLTHTPNELRRDALNVLDWEGDPCSGMFRKVRGSGRALGPDFDASLAPMTCVSMSSKTGLIATTSLPSADEGGIFDDAEEDSLIERHEGKVDSNKETPIDLSHDPPGKSSCTATRTTESPSVTSEGVFDDAEDDIDGTVRQFGFEDQTQSSHLSRGHADSSTVHICAPPRTHKGNISSLPWPARRMEGGAMRCSGADHGRPFSSFSQHSSPWDGMSFGNDTGVSVGGPKTSSPQSPFLRGDRGSSEGKKEEVCNEVSNRESASNATVTIDLPQPQASATTAEDEKQTAKHGADHKNGEEGRTVHVPLHPQRSGAHGQADPSSNNFSRGPSASPGGGQQAHTHHGVNVFSGDSYDYSGSFRTPAVPSEESQDPSKISRSDGRVPSQERVFGQAGRSHLATSNETRTPSFPSATKYYEKEKSEHQLRFKTGVTTGQRHQEGGPGDRGEKKHQTAPGQSIASKPPTPASVPGSSYVYANGEQAKTTFTPAMNAPFSGLSASQVQPKNDAAEKKVVTTKKERPFLPLSKNLSQESGSQSGGTHTGNAGLQVSSSSSGVPGMEPESKKKSRQTELDDGAVGVPSKPRNQNQPKLDTSLFPVALYVMVRDETNNTQDDTVSWDRDNRSFLVRTRKGRKPQSQVNSQQRGLEEVLCTYFPKWRDSSRPKEAFWSQLRNYGFMAERLPQNGDGVSATRYSHAHFHRDMTDFTPMRTLPPALRPNWSNTTRRKRTRDCECCDDTEGRTANSFSSTTTSALVEVDGAKSESSGDDVSGCVEKHPKKICASPPNGVQERPVPPSETSSVPSESEHCSSWAKETGSTLSLAGRETNAKETHELKG